jgi:hypothetical protein
MVTIWGLSKKIPFWNFAKCLKLLAPPAGLEPAAPGLGILCSIHLSYEGKPLCTSQFLTSSWPRVKGRKAAEKRVKDSSACLLSAVTTSSTQYLLMGVSLKKT